MSVISSGNSSRKSKKRHSTVPILIAPDPRELMEAPSNTDINKVKRQMGIVYKIWTDTHKALCEATNQAFSVKSETTTLKAVISFILMKKFFLEVGKKLPPMAIMDNWKVGDIVTFVRRANNTGRFLDQLEFDDNEQMGLILVSLRYSTEPFILAGAAWELAEHNINLAVQLLCPCLYSMKNRDYDFLGQEVANLRIYWQGQCSAEESDENIISKLFEIGATCDEQAQQLWDILYDRLEHSYNPCGVPQFVNLLGGFSLNGTLTYSELARLINEKITLDWLDERYGDAGRIISLIWNRVYNLIVDEDDHLPEKQEEKMDNMREFLDMITQTVDDERANEIFLHMKLPELTTTDITANSIDKDPINNQFFKYTSTCRDYPLYYTRRAFDLTSQHMTKTLDIMAWWKEYRNPFDLSADSIWDYIFHDKETDEDSLVTGYGNLEDFNRVCLELIKNNTFRKGVDLDQTEQEFYRVFSDLASGNIQTLSQHGSSRYRSLPRANERIYNGSNPSYHSGHSHHSYANSRSSHPSNHQPIRQLKKQNNNPIQADARSFSSDSTQEMIIRKSKSPAEMKMSQKKSKATRYRSSKMEKKTSKDNLRKQGRTSSNHNKMSGIDSTGSSPLLEKMEDKKFIMESMESLNLKDESSTKIATAAEPSCAADAFN